MKLSLHHEGSVFDTVVRPHLDSSIGKISHRLYGHFAEHLGKCSYGGFWVGTDCNKAEHVDGFRKNVLDALKAMPTPFLRWPGGCYADHYHWQDGIGKERLSRLGMSCGLSSEDDNTLGTHEFLDFCDRIGAEPYLAGNMGSGSVQELCDWIEYTNCAVSTKLTRTRKDNGRQHPWNVRVWGVGNESWGCGGNYTAEHYAVEYRRYATMLRHVDPSVELVVVGFEADWNRRVLELLKGHHDLVSHFSIHRYWINGGPGSKFSEEQYYTLIQEADDTEKFVVETRAILDEVAPEGSKHIGIALDEWGVWHPEVREWGPDGTHSKDVNNYEQAGTMRDAIAAAVCLEGFHRQCKSLSMANLAQVVNVLHAPIMASDDGFCLTPTYHLLHMHAGHINAEALKVSVDSKAKLPLGTPAVSATASQKDGGLTVTVVNRSYSVAHNVLVEVPATGDIKGYLLAASNPADQNTPAEPDKVTLKEFEVNRVDKGVGLTLPPASIVTLEVR